MNHKVIEEFFARELTSKLRDILIIDNNFGGYDLFGKYRIVRLDDESYSIKIKGKDDPIHFATLPHAVTWCIYDKNHKFWELKKIQDLDETLSHIDFTIAAQKKLLTNSKLRGDKFIYLAKLNEAKLKRQLISDKMNSYVVTSKYWQSKKFEDNRRV